MVGEERTALLVFIGVNVSIFFFEIQAPFSLLYIIIIELVHDEKNEMIIIPFQFAFVVYNAFVFPIMVSKQFMFRRVRNLQKKP